jgi:hypothetical protein
MKRLKVFSVLATIIFLTISFYVSGQEKGSLKLGLMYTQVNDQAPVLRLSTKTKKGKKFEQVEGIEITLSFMEETPKGFLGKVKTDKAGLASFELPAQILPTLDSLSPFKFIATTASNEQFDAVTSESEITKARIELALPEVDSTRAVEAKVLALQEGKWTEVPEVEVKLFVKRLFSDLPLGEGTYTTNETGQVSGEFNTNIPGDGEGNIIVGAKIDDNETYGTIISVKSVKWGVPLKDDRSFYKRTLWAARDKTPLWLLIFPNIIIITVWGFIFYLFYLIRIIRKV